MLAVTGVFSFLVTTARGDSEIVIAIRYLPAEGISHSQLYLYREDGNCCALDPISHEVLWDCDVSSHRFSIMLMY
jgi:hypothetical protein